MILLDNMNLPLSRIFNQVVSSSSDWIGWLIGGLGILIGAIIAVVIYKLSRIGPRLSYQMEAERLIGGPQATLPAEVSILFKGNVVPRVTRTYVYMWNSGRATVDGKQMVSEDPLRLEYNHDIKVLQATAIKKTRDVNKLNVEINPNAENVVLCTFDYLDMGDGVKIEVLHTGENKYPIMKGTIRGMPKGIIDCGLVSSLNPVSSRIAGIGVRTFMNYYMVIASLAILLSGIFYPLWISAKARQSDAPFHWVLIGIGLYMTLIAGFVLWQSRRRFPSSLR